MNQQYPDFSNVSYNYYCIYWNTFSLQVAWLKSDSKAILAIHTNMIALNPRLSVTYNNHNTWKLHVSNVQANDSGTYMCQVNTDPMKSQVRATTTHTNIVALNPRLSVTTNIRNTWKLHVSNFQSNDSVTYMSPQTLWRVR